MRSEGAVLPPIATPYVHARGLALNAQQIVSFHENGFLALPAISTAEEVASLRALFYRLLGSRAGFYEGAQFDMLDDNESLGRNSLVQICDPDNYAAQLRHTIFGTKALAIAKQLLGPGAQPAFSHAIYKPAHYGAPTPWHQDDAFHVDFDCPQISI